jgi:hypothetical protein
MKDSDDIGRWYTGSKVQETEPNDNFSLVLRWDRGFHGGDGKKTAPARKADTSKKAYHCQGGRFFGDQPK